MKINPKWGEEIRKHKKKIIVSLFVLALAVVIYLLAGDYIIDHNKYVAAPDLILDNIGPYDLSYIFVWYFILVLGVYFIYPLIKKPNEFHYFVIMFSLVLVVRSAFVLFTHLAVPLDAITAKFPSFLKLLDFSNALFFSGHTAFLFLDFFCLRKINHLDISCFFLQYC